MSNEDMERKGMFTGISAGIEITICVIVNKYG